jgi:hypothetical protein
MRYEEASMVPMRINVRDIRGAIEYQQRPVEVARLEFYDPEKKKRTVINIDVGEDWHGNLFVRMCTNGSLAIEDVSKTTIYPSDEIPALDGILWGDEEG